MNNSPSNIFQPLLSLKSYHQSSQAVLAATDMNGLMTSDARPTTCVHLHDQSTCQRNQFALGNFTSRNNVTASNVLLLNMV